MERDFKEEICLSQAQLPSCLGLDHLFSRVWTTGQGAAGEIGARRGEGMSSHNPASKACLQGPGVSNQWEGLLSLQLQRIDRLQKKAIPVEFKYQYKKVPVSDNQPQLILSAQVGLFFFSFF